MAVTHLSKSGGPKAIYRAMGSLAFAAASRAVWAIVKDPDDPKRRCSCRRSSISPPIPMAWRTASSTGEWSGKLGQSPCTPTMRSSRRWKAIESPTVRQNAMMPPNVFASTSAPAPCRRTDRWPSRADHAMSSRPRDALAPDPAWPVHDRGAIRDGLARTLWGRLLAKRLRGGTT